MFEKLLNGIFDRNGLDDTNAKAQYLRELRPCAKQLWHSYRTNNVTTDYSEAKTQEAYLLRYFPFYTLLVETELDALRTDGITLPEVELLDACFLGCGPGPEVIGLIRHLRKSNAETSMLTAKMVDMAAATWTHSQEIVRDFLAEPFWEPGLLEYEASAVSLSDTQTLREMNIEGCHLAVVQNCLNEVPSADRSRVMGNILEIFSQLSTGAIALVIDRAGYPEVFAMMREMQSLANGIERLTPIGDSYLAERTINCHQVLDSVPSIITENLHHISGSKPKVWDENGLIFAKRVKYYCTAFQVGTVSTAN